MPQVACLGFKQSFEKGASLSIRNSCLRCGRTKEAHELNTVYSLPGASELAEEWLKENGYKGLGPYELIKGALINFIKDKHLGI